MAKIVGGFRKKVGKGRVIRSPKDTAKNVPKRSLADRVATNKKPKVKKVTYDPKNRVTNGHRIATKKNTDATKTYMCPECDKVHDSAKKMFMCEDSHKKRGLLGS